MKSDSRSCYPAQVDVANAIFPEGRDMGFDLTNEIDVWAQMQFRARHQIQRLKHSRPMTPIPEATKAHSLIYSTRHRFEV